VNIDYNDQSPETETANGHGAVPFSGVTRPLIPHQTGPGQAADTAETAEPVADAAPSEQAAEPEQDGASAPLVDKGADSGPDRLASMLAARRLPLLPDWARSIEDMKRTAKFVAGHYWHIVRFHAMRSPLYLARIALRSPAGLARTLRGFHRWAQDAEGQGIRLDAANRNDPETYLKLANLRDKRVSARSKVFWTSILLGLAGAAGLIVAGTALMQAGALAVGALTFGVVGAPKDKPITARAVVKPEYAKLTSDVILRALGSLGIPALTQAVAKGGRGLAFVTPIAMDGPGFRAELDLPFGVTAVDVMDKRTELASGLRRPLGCVWPEPVHDEHSGRLVIWVGRQEMRKTPPPAWPLAKGSAFDIFKPIPFGTDQRGRVTYVQLVENNVLVGALPGGGKSYAIQPLVYGAALDPNAVVWSVNLKGDAFHKNTKAFADRYIDGIDDESIEATLSLLRDLKAEVIRRTKVFKNLPPSINPEGKINPAIAGRRSLGLPVLLAFIDECQNLFAHKKFGDEAGELAEFVIKVGRSLGVILLLATQRPDKDSLPTGVSANTSIRFCLRVMGQTENDMILGTSAYKNGIRATQFTLADKGIGYLVGASEEPQITRTYKLDQNDTAAIAAKARALRIAAGTLSGYALDPDGYEGKVQATTSRTVLDDLDELFATLPFHEEKIRGEELLPILQAHNPGVYDAWKVETLTGALKPHGVASIDVSRRDGGKQTVRKGYTRDALRDAITNRNRPGQSG
jgi:S-DNA-T family DNA segregation ATPase FtsK/SpoIIIE